ncbi:MAG: RNA polymerase sigma factor [Proteobacteria bacterium]|nr:RNA polymerase sigma factor [Pseudomonadota bacterium]
MRTEADEGLAGRAAGGDREAFSALLELHYGRIYRLGLRLLGDPDDAADLAQEVCVSLATKVRGFRGESRFSTWLYRVVLNAARDARRRSAARQRLNRLYADARALEGAGRDPRDAELRWLHRALEALSPELRETAVLVLQEGLSHAQAGVVLGLRPSTVSWRMHELRKRLKRMAESDEDVEP